MPAAVATLAYLNARTQFSYDYSLVSSLILSGRRSASLEKKDRLNLYYALEDHAKAKSTANSPFLVYQGKEWTYKEVYEIVLKYATWLKTKYAVAPREVVAMDFMNSAQFVFLCLAIWSLGATPAFINYNLTGTPLVHCLKTSTARIVFVDEEVKSQFSPDVLEAVSSAEFRNGRSTVEIVYFGPEVEKQISSMSGVREPDSSRSGAKVTMIAVLIYTSGTTGLPKPAIVSWYKARSGGTLFDRWMGMTKKDRYYTVRRQFPFHLPYDLAEIRTLVYASLPFRSFHPRFHSDPHSRSHSGNRPSIQQSYLLAGGS